MSCLCRTIRVRLQVAFQLRCGSGHVTGRRGYCFFRQSRTPLAGCGHNWPLWPQPNPVSSKTCTFPSTTNISILHARPLRGHKHGQSCSITAHSVAGQCISTKSLIMYCRSISRSPQVVLLTLTECTSTPSLIKNLWEIKSGFLRD